MPALGILLCLCVSITKAQKKPGGGAAGNASGSSSPSAAASTPTASNAPFEVEMLAYGGLDALSKQIANYACGKAAPAILPAPAKPIAARFSKVVIIDPPTIQALQAYDAFMGNATAVASAFSAMEGKSSAGGGIDDFSDITNAVTAVAVSSTSESSSSFTIQDPSVALILLHQLQAMTANSACTGAYYAGIYSVNEAHGVALHGNTIVSVPDTLSALAGLRMDTLKSLMTSGQSFDPAVRRQIPCAPAPSATAINAPVLAAPPGGGPAPAPFPSLYSVSSQDPCITAFNNLDGTYNSFLGGLQTPNSTTGQPALASVLQGFRLRTLFSSASLTEPMLGIYVSVAAAGGTQQDRKNLLTAIFTGDWIRYSGGVSVNLVVFQIAHGLTAADDNSKILFSDVIRYRTPLEKIKRPTKYDDAAEAGDNLSVIPQP
jgi:hypothetical protein